ncbi:MAG: sodium:solute symporter family protein [Halanaerobiaceae bacterium]
MSVLYVYLAVIIYIIIGTIIAWKAREGLEQGILEYYLGGRKINGIIAALSYSATTYSAFMMIGLAGYTYSGGVGALGFELVYLSGLSLVAFFGPRFWLIGQKNDYLSPYEMLGDRYQSEWIPVILAASACIFLIPYLAVQLMGVGYLMSGLSGGNIPFITGVLIAAVLAIAWALIAGMRSVTWTDSLQSLIMITVSVLILFFVVYQEFNGFMNFFKTLETDYSRYLSVPGPGFFNLNNFIGLTLPWFFFSISNPQVSQRLFIPDSLKSMKIMIKGFLIFGLIYTLVSVFWGFTALTLIPGLDQPDMATPQLLGSKYVPVSLGLVAMIGITAAAISTIDSIMLTLSSVLVQDIFGKVKKQSNRVRNGKIIIILIALIGVIFASQKLDLIATLSVASSAGLLVVVPTIFGAFFWKASTAAGALTSIIAGTITTFILQLGNIQPMGIWPGVWTLLISSVLFISVSLFTSPPEKKAEEFIGYINQELKKRNIL